MKPIKLTLTAFGPFQETETVDFANLGQSPLFLINGPTGAGKTSILDGICFALYGKTTGNERDAGQMRCHFSPDDLLTEVSLTFELGDKRYNIRRSPQQEKPKSRGDGFVTKSPEAELTLLNSDNSIEKVLVPSKVSEANQHIENLLGLNVDQFRQVMVLPQGKFRELLVADSASRERIFSQLFQTHLFQKIEAILKERSADIRNRVTQSRTSMMEVLSQIDLTSLEQLQVSLSYSVVDEQQKQLRFKAVKQLVDEAKVALNNSLRLEDLFKQHSELTKKKTLLDSSKESMNIKRDFVKKVSQVVEYESEFNLLKNAQSEFKQAEELKISASKDLDAASEARKKLELELSQLPQLSSEVEILNQKVYALEMLLPLVAELEQLQLQKAEYSSKISHQLDRQSDISKRLSNLDAELERVSLEHQHCQSRKEGIESAIKRLPTIEKAIDLQQRIISKGNKINELELSLDSSKEQGLNLKRDYDKNVYRLNELELAWHLGQAAELAKTLKNNEACPVCGSHEHPAPTQSSGSVVTRDQIKQQQDVVNNINDQLVELRSKYSFQKKQLEEEHSEKSTLVSQFDCLGLEAHESADLISCVNELREQEASLVDLNKQILKLNDTIETHPTLKAEINEALNQAALAIQEARVQLVSTEDAIAKIEAKLANSGSEPKEIPNKIISLKGKIEVIHSQIKSLDKRDREIQQLLAESLAKHKLHSQQVDDRKREVLDKEKAFLISIKSIKINNISDFYDLLIQKSEMIKAQEQIKQFETEYTQLSADIASIDKLICDQSLPQTHLIKLNLEELTLSLQSIESSWMASYEHLSYLKRLAERVEKQSDQLLVLESEYKVVGTLSDVANGQNSHKVSFQRFVLSVLLDDVLAEASHRLMLMSKGRYQLLRKIDRAKGNKASGLELEVEDAHTGRTRAVETLSGGEGFMAALSLALGLSDVVQGYSGGVRLDVLFIDEGFGSLDSEALDLAVSALIDLHSSGRMIGIISHVAELKEQIALKINLVTGQSGSHILQTMKM